MFISFSPSADLRRIVLSAGCLLGLAGCVSSTPPIPAAGTQFDGLYQGENRLVRGSGFICDPPAGADSVFVSNGRFVYPFSPSPPRPVPFPVQIAADGSLHGEMQYAIQDYVPRPQDMTFWVTANGRITGGTLDAVVVDDRCTRHLMLQKR